MNNEVISINNELTQQWIDNEQQLKNKQVQKDFENKMIEKSLDGATGRHRLAETILNHYKSDKSDLNTMSIINAITGAGKTYAITQKLIPAMMSDGVEFITLISPDTSAYSVTELRTLCMKNNYELVVTPKIIPSLNQYLHCREQAGMSPRVLIFAHNKNFYDGDIVDTMLNYTENIAVVVDEVHLTMTSGEDNYLLNNGNKPPYFDANMYTQINRLSEHTPLVYGLSATPTPEQDENYPNEQHIEPLGSLKYEILDVPFSPHDRLTCTSYMSKAVRYNANDEDDCFAVLYTALDYHFGRISKLNGYDSSNNFPEIPMSMMIFAARDGANAGLGVSQIKDFITNYCVKNNIMDSGSDLLPFAQMTGQGTFQYRARKGKKCGWYASEATFGTGNSSDKIDSRRELYKALDNPHHPISIMIVVDVGNVGINVNSIKTQVCFRGNDATGSEGEGLYSKPTQKIGRSSRLNITKSQREVIDKVYNGSIEEWWKSLSKVELRRFIDANKIKIFYPTTLMVDEALEIIRKRAMLPVEKARKLINYIHSN